MNKIAKKRWFKSKTVWFNVISGAVDVVNILKGNVIPPGTVTIITNVGNIILRALTKEGIGK